MTPLYINEPCSENWSAMLPTEKGAFCMSCTKEVIDFSTQSPEEIKLTLKKNLGQKVCGRITTSQIDEFNRGFNAWESSRVQHFRAASYLALIAVFGMTLFSCQSPEAEVMVEQWQRVVQVNEPDQKVQEEIVLEDMIEAIPAQKRLLTMHHDYIDERELVQATQIDPYHMEFTTEREMHMGMMEYSVAVEEYIDLGAAEGMPQYDRNGILIPEEYQDLAYPNPTWGQSTYKLELPQEGLFVIGLYDMNGRHLRNLHEGEFEAGTHTFDVNLFEELSGTFLVVCRSKNFSNTQRIIKM